MPMQPDANHPTHPSQPPAHTPPPSAFTPPHGGDMVPLEAAERSQALDTLRGVALLGILTMNIMTFALPLASYGNPVSEVLAKYAGPFEGMNVVVWALQYVVFNTKMMNIFSMLFGAGLIVLSLRASSRAVSLAGLYYRRVGWLILFGLFHAYFIWFGDVLFMYGVWGLLLYPCRNFRPRTLYTLGGVSLVVSVLIGAALGGALLLFRTVAMEALAAQEAGKELTQEQTNMIAQWQETLRQLNPSAEQVEQEVQAVRGGALSAFKHNASMAFFLQLMMLFMGYGFHILGMMLIGMGLMKQGVFTASRSSRFYIMLTAIGYGIGLPIVIYGGWSGVQAGFDPVREMLYGMHINAVGGVAVALGHVGAIMLFCQSGALPALRARLAAAGRMALTNYLSQSIICTFIFFGWGLGFFGTLHLKWLMLVVLAVWALQLTWSPFWLARFRFGPAEWLWRSLTYWQRQPMRR
ncbi:MAG: DUF418 domain-containing protein [Phycisphaeraceae bacterium]|nr:DUF418 domain-containing protein [Phycisphaeraceae bacterium]